MDKTGQTRMSVGVENNSFLFGRFLRELPPESPIALESVGQRYWIVDEMEKARYVPRLAYAGKANLIPDVAVVLRFNRHVPILDETLLYTQFFQNILLNLSTYPSAVLLSLAGDRKMRRVF